MEHLRIWTTSVHCTSTTDLEISHIECTTKPAINIWTLNTKLSNYSPSNNLSKWCCLFASSIFPLVSSDSEEFLPRNASFGELCDLLQRLCPSKWAVDALTSQALFTLLSLGQTAMRLSIVSHTKSGTRMQANLTLMFWGTLWRSHHCQCKLSINEVVVNGEVYIAHFHLIRLLCLAGICAGYVDLLQANWSNCKASQLVLVPTLRVSNPLKVCRSNKWKIVKSTPPVSHSSPLYYPAPLCLPELCWSEPSSSTLVKMKRWRSSCINSTKPWKVVCS